MKYLQASSPPTIEEVFPCTETRSKSLLHRTDEHPTVIARDQEEEIASANRNSVMHVDRSESGSTQLESQSPLDTVDALNLIDLPHDATLSILSFLDASDLDYGVSLTCKKLQQESSSAEIWKEYCARTGKDFAYDSHKTSIGISSDCSSFFQLYHSIACVPEDFSTITQALYHSSPGATITLMPGVYEERIVIHKSIRIRASHPAQGASIIWHHTAAGSSSCENEERNISAVEVVESCTYASLHHLTILHSSQGSDIWNGNCALFCHGDLTHTLIDSCSIQSDSGRGIVVTNGASLKLSRSSVHNCAATGLYVGDGDSIVAITRCNILWNGFGGRNNRRRSSSSSSSTESDEQAPSSSSAVPWGHSGLYVEAAKVEIKNTLLAGNCLTGISVVRHGCVHICGCDVTANGQAPIVFFESPPNDNHDGQGGVYEADNNFGEADEYPSDIREKVRYARHVLHEFLTPSFLESMYKKMSQMEDGRRKCGRQTTYCPENALV